jgi:WD40 repeat protein
LNVRLINPETGQSIATLESPIPNRLGELCFSPDGAHLAVATSNRIIQLWDLRTIRMQLKEIGLDWHQPNYAPPSWSSSSVPLKCEVIIKREGS